MTKLRVMFAQSGFSLLEIVTVVAIIGILAAAGISSYQELRERSRDAQRAAALKQLQIAIENYKDTYGEYPDGCASGSSWSGNVRAGSFKCTNANEDFILGLVPEFMPALPRDPLYNSAPSNYGYLYRTDGTNQSYKLLVHRTVESETIDWGHPLARCPVQCNGSPSASASCTPTAPEFVIFTSSYAAYSTGTLMCT